MVIQLLNQNIMFILLIVIKKNLALMKVVLQKLMNKKHKLQQLLKQIDKARLTQLIQKSYR